MRSAAAVLPLVGLAAAQGVTSAIAPSASAPAGCKADQKGNFEISVQDIKEKRDVSKTKRAACSGDGVLVASLADGVIKDAQQRTGYIASNYQFQFDGPPQAGAIYTSGFSACDNSSLALGGSTVFYKCLSGDFWNLYDRSWAAQCSPVEILVMPCGGDSQNDKPNVNEVGDGQVTVGTNVATTTVVVPLSDGQPQVVTTTTPIPLCEISDGQAQVKTVPCVSITTTKPVPVSEQSDGQVQVTPPAGGSGGSGGSGPGTSGAGEGSATTTPAETGGSSGMTTSRTTAASPPNSTGGGGGAGASTTGTGSGSDESGATGQIRLGSAAAAMVLGLVGVVFML